MTRPRLRALRNEPDRQRVGRLLRANEQRCEKNSGACKSTGGVNVGGSEDTVILRINGLLLPKLRVALVGRKIENNQDVIVHEFYSEWSVSLSKGRCGGSG
jgi:hypothetical protein